MELTLAGLPHSHSAPDEGAGVVEPEYPKDLSVERSAEDVRTQRVICCAQTEVLLGVAYLL